MRWRTGGEEQARVARGRAVASDILPRGSRQIWGGDRSREDGSKREHIVFNKSNSYEC